MNIVDYYDTPIVRLSPAENETGWDGETPTKFKMGSIVVFDVTLNDAVPTGLDINDRTVSESAYTIEDNRIYGQITIDDSCYRSCFCFIDIHSDKLCEDYTVNSFYVSPTDQYIITADSTVQLAEDHELCAIWKKIRADVPGDVTGDGIIDAVDASSVLAYYARTATNQEGGYTEEQLLAADINHDGEINAVDASNILAYYAYTAVTDKNVMSLEEFMKSRK